jgi:UDPglucose 6-dehydrogenase
MLVSVFGTGYLGATHAACLAAEGHDVVGVDHDGERVSTLSSGHAPFREDRLDDLLAEGLASGRLRFTTDVAAAAGADVHFLCVGTPGNGTGLDLSALRDVVAALTPLLVRPCTLVGRSTVPVGTARAVREVVQHGAPAGAEVGVAWNPEFLREGHAVEDSMRPHRIVVGVDSEDDLRRVEDVYRPWLDRDVPFLRTNLPTAELAKLSANSMLAARVSMVNVLAELCEAAGADVDELLAVVGADPRIGHDFLQPGPGYGGSCLPKDLRALAATARDHDLPVAAALLDQTNAVNDWQRERAAEAAVALLDGSMATRRVAVLGAAFKAGSDDVRDSPALDVAERLSRRGAAVVVYDPAVHHTGSTGLDAASSAEDACAGADLVVIATEWPEFSRLDPARLREVVARPRVIDLRRIIDRDRWRRAGWSVRTVGDPEPPQLDQAVPA